MRPLVECRVCRRGECVRNVLIEQRKFGRRSGAVMIVDEAGMLCGIFTDSDLARLLESRREGLIDGPIEAVMTTNPVTATLGDRLVEAVELLADRKISELPVVDGTASRRGCSTLPTWWAGRRSRNRGAK